MSTPGGPIIRTLSDWTEQRFTALYQAGTKEEFQTAFNGFVSKHAEVTLNGKKISVGGFEEQLWDAQANKRSFDVTYLGTVDIPTNADEPLEVRTLLLTPRQMCSHSDLN